MSPPVSSTVQIAKTAFLSVEIIPKSLPPSFIKWITLAYDHSVPKTNQVPNVQIIAITGGGAVDPKIYLNLALKLGAVRTFAKGEKYRF